MSTTAPSRARSDYGTGREALIAAFITVVAERGLRGATYRAIAAEAGVAHALVAHHFGTRETLLREAMNAAIAESLRRSSFDPPGEHIGDFARGLETLVLENKPLQAFQYEVLLEARRNPDLAAIATEYHRAYLAATARQLEQYGISDPAVHSIIWAALDGLVFHNVVHGATDTADALKALRARLAALAAD